ncbi:hypothetical protein Tco_0035069, partial [Tanacetum coccineum]
SGHGNYCNFHIDDLVPTDLDDGKDFEACDFDDHLVQTDGPYFLDEERKEFKRRICHLLKLKQKKPPLLPRKDSRTEKNVDWLHDALFRKNDNGALVTRLM